MILWPSSLCCVTASSYRTTGATEVCITLPSPWLFYCFLFTWVFIHSASQGLSLVTCRPLKHSHKELATQSLFLNLRDRHKKTVKAKRIRSLCLHCSGDLGREQNFFFFKHNQVFLWSTTSGKNTTNSIMKYNSKQFNISWLRRTTLKTRRNNKKEIQIVTHSRNKSNKCTKRRIRKNG